MNTTFFSHFYPFGLLIVQTFIFLFFWFTVLKRMKILRLPMQGMEYGHMIMSAALLFGGLYISLSDNFAAFQSFKIFSNGEHAFMNTFNKFSQYFIIVFFMQLFYLLLATFVIKIVFGFKNTKENVEEGHIVPAMLSGVIIIVFAMVINDSSKDIILSLVPQAFDFR